MIKNFNLFNESKKDKFPNIKTLNIDGYIVLIGRDALSNDYLTINMANPDDMWFHVKGVPGSHIVVRMIDGVTMKYDTKLKVANLAVKNSKCKEYLEVKVVCCKAKFVKKDKDSNPGKVVVDYDNAEEIIINI